MGPVDFESMFKDAETCHAAISSLKRLVVLEKWTRVNEYQYSRGPFHGAFTGPIVLFFERDNTWRFHWGDRLFGGYPVSLNDTFPDAESAMIAADSAMLKNNHIRLICPKGTP
jgi:hypothetical protein